MITTEFSNAETSLTRYPREFDEDIKTAQKLAEQNGVKLSKTAVVGLSLRILRGLLNDIKTVST